MNSVLYFSMQISLAFSGKGGGSVTKITLWKFLISTIATLKSKKSYSENEFKQIFKKEPIEYN